MPSAWISGLLLAAVLLATGSRPNGPVEAVPAGATVAPLFRRITF